MKRHVVRLLGWLVFAIFIAALSNIATIYIYFNSGGDYTERLDSIILSDALPGEPPRVSPGTTPPNNTYVATTTPLSLSMAKEAVVRIRTVTDAGSGVIIDSKGIVLTSAHSVGSNEQVWIVLTDSTNLMGSVIKIDKARDLALLELPAGNYPSLPLGNKSDIVDGGSIIAISYPLNLPGPSTATGGIISRIYRNSEARRNEFQTDAAINMGSSGGPIINPEGKILGIISSVLGEYRSFPTTGIAFAVSVETIRNEFLNGISILDP